MPTRWQQKAFPSCRWLRWRQRWVFCSERFLTIDVLLATWGDEWSWIDFYCNLPLDLFVGLFFIVNVALLETNVSIYQFQCLNSCINVIHTTTWYIQIQIIILDVSCTLYHSFVCVVQTADLLPGPCRVGSSVSRSACNGSKQPGARRITNRCWAADGPPTMCMSSPQSNGVNMMYFSTSYRKLYSKLIWYRYHNVETISQLVVVLVNWAYHRCHHYVGINHHQNQKFILFYKS